MRALICGSVAYDNIMVFPGRFQDHILPEQIHILNISFPVPEMRREFGGCAGNIAYNLKLIGGDPLVMATVGDDAGPYLERMDRFGLLRTHVRQIPGSFTAQAFITTDLNSNQITAFHPGAMSFSHMNKVTQAQGIDLGIVAPDGREGMLQHARDLAAAGIPFIFDPGQALPLFDGDDLLEFLDLADYACFNDYEMKLTCDRTGRSVEQLTMLVEALIVTKGADGSEIYVGDRCLSIPCVQAESIVDPTGCGDAYRAGLLYGIMNKWDWIRTGRLAALMGAYKIA
ncbi:MAG: carbohydrate kinase family protein, partial [Azovibrio sp.]